MLAALSFSRSMVRRAKKKKKTDHVKWAHYTSSVREYFQEHERKRLTTFLEKLLFILASKQETTYINSVTAKDRKIRGILTGSTPHSSAATRNYSKTKRANFSWKPRPKKKVLKPTVYGGRPKVTARKLFRHYFAQNFLVMPWLDDITLLHTLSDEIKILMCLYHNYLMQ